jgi:predicted nucleic acid-binding protein
MDITQVDGQAIDVIRHQMLRLDCRLPVHGTSVGSTSMSPPKGQRYNAIWISYTLYTCVIIPQAVFGELQEDGTPLKVKEWVAMHPDWLVVCTVSLPLDASLAFLDVGEREAICLATEREADALIIDEPEGREAAKRQGIRVIGTLRVLYDAASDCAILRKLMNAFSDPPFESLQIATEFSCICTAKGESDL